MFDISEAHTIFGEIYFRSKDYPKAIESYLNAGKICDEIYQKDKSHFEAVYKTRLIYQKLSEIYQQTGNLSLARQYQSKLDKLSDSATK